MFSIVTYIEKEYKVSSVNKRFSAYSYAGILISLHLGPVCIAVGGQHKGHTFTFHNKRIVPLNTAIYNVK
jgi:hypothetical protein